MALDNIESGKNLHALNTLDFDLLINFADESSAQKSVNQVYLHILGHLATRWSEMVI